MLTEDRLKEIREREQKATPGPWRSMSHGNCQMEDGLLACIAEVEGLPRPWNPVWVGWQSAKNYFKTFMRQEDADFVAHSRQDVSDLLADRATLTAEHERLSRENEEASEEIAILHNTCERHEKTLRTALKERDALAARLAERDKPFEKNGIKAGERVVVAGLSLAGTVLACSEENVRVLWDDRRVGDLSWDGSVAYNAYNLQIIRAPSPPVKDGAQPPKTGDK